MLRSVHLHGRLATICPEPIELDTVDTADVVRALCCTFPVLKRELRKGTYRVVRGPTPELGYAMSVEELQFGLGFNPVHIIPVAEGAGGGGIGKTILGVALMAVAIVAAIPTGGMSLVGGTTFAASMGMGVMGTFVTWGNIAMMGLAMTLGGMAQMLSPQPSGPKDMNITEPGNYESPANRPSYLFNGAINMSEQGHPMPLCYGRVRTGSIVGSAGIETVDIDPNLDNSGTVVYPVVEAV